MVRAYDVIKRKRDGRRLSEAEITGFLDGYLDGQIPDYQMSALLMAVYFNGLESDELAVWASRMLHSGTVLDFADIPGPKVDKHSTGGVGDKISLPLAPLVAAVGVKVPMISGRGLGHTGGTLDKLESIPGFSVNLSASTFRKLVHEVGVCMMGQTADLCPLDRKLYALRDVTATVDSIPLIASSIMSKKLAEGIDALVLDVKVGSGAFMKTREDARRLAETMVAIGARMDKRVVAVLTDMSQPLGEAVGNAIETIESVEILKGRGPADILELTLVLGAWMVRLAGLADDEVAARRLLQGAIDDGSALAKMREMVAAQGGDPAALDDYDRFATAAERIPFPAPADGVVQSIDTERVGRASLALGAGRVRVDSPIDPAVGLLVHARVGDEVAAGDPLVTMLVNDHAGLDDARRLLSEAYVLADGSVERGPLVIDVVS